MHDISPVLSGKFNNTDALSAVTNINAPAHIATADASSASAVSGISDSTSSSYVDPRRYSKFDRSASQVADAPDFSFHDFLDMVNPLQHIPVASSVYRAATGDTINPVARVAGDILYGGALGAVSAVISGAGSIADAVSESQTGYDKTGTVLASLFGDDKSDTQVAQANTAAGTQQPVSQTAAVSGAPVLSPVTPAPLTPATQVAAAATSTSPLTQAKAFPLNRQAYGGVMAPPLSMEDQNRVIALSQGSHAMRLGNTLYTSPLMNGPHPMSSSTSVAAAPTASPTPIPAEATNVSVTPTATAATTASSPNAATATDNAAAALPAMSATANNSIVSAGQHNSLPQNLIDDMVMMKALGQYKGVAAGPASPLGSSLDVRN
jgi:hypothetical protein